MKTNPILDIKEHVGFFNGVAPVLALPFPLEAVALGMDNNLSGRPPHGFAVFFGVRTTVMDSSNFDSAVETDFAFASGTTKTFGRKRRRTIDDTSSGTPFHNGFSRLCEHFQPVGDSSADDSILGCSGVLTVVVSHACRASVELNVYESD